MQLTIFAKKLTSQDGRTYYKYLTTLKRKVEGGELEDVTTVVKFREDCGAPKGDQCPINIIVEKTDCNYREKLERYTDDAGEEQVYNSKVLWISNWSPSPEKYVDTSMDQFVE